jgi:hypothetical protein
MKYSLRSLMIGMTLLSAGSGMGWNAWRTSKLISLAQEHERHWNTCLLFGSKKTGFCVNDQEAAHFLATGAWHLEMATECRYVAWRPWLELAQTPPPRFEDFR